MYKKNTPGVFDGDADNNEKRRKEKSESELCLSSALLIIRSGENTKKMIREKLLKKGFSKEAVEDVIIICEEKGFLNDKRLLFTYTESLAYKKLYGPYRIRLEVSKRFDREVIEKYLNDALEKIDFYECASRLYKKNSGKERDFIIRSFSRNGFSAEHIKYVIKK